MPRGGALGWRLPTKGGCALKGTTVVLTYVSVLLAGVLRILLGFKVVLRARFVKEEAIFLSAGGGSMSGGGGHWLSEEASLLSRGDDRGVRRRRQD